MIIEAIHPFIILISFYQMLKMAFIIKYIPNAINTIPAITRIAFAEPFILSLL